MNPSNAPAENCAAALRTLACCAMLGLTLGVRGQSVSIVPITVPGAASVSVNAMNGAGHVAGAYFDAYRVQRGFLWRDGVAQNLGALGGGESAANALNSADRVAGYAATGGEAEFRAFVFGDGVMTNIGGLGGFASWASAANDAGQVVGDSFLVDGMSLHAFLYDAGVVHDLGTLGGSYSSATALNRVGQVVGQANVAGDAESHAFLFSAGSMRDLGTLGGTMSFATALSAHGWTTGRATTEGDAETHAFLHNGLTLQDLGTLGGQYSSGRAVNEAGQVIGDSSLTGEAESHGFIFSDGVLHDLGTLGGGSSSPWAINGVGQVVGVSANGDGVPHAFLWQNGLMVDLNSLLPADSGWVLDGAYFINEAGQVAGNGTYQGEPSWFVMTVPLAGNRPPVANAGPNQAVESTGVVTSVTLDGRASSDPDGDALTFEWFANGQSLGTTPQLTVGLRVGSQTFTLRVTDGSSASAEDTVDVSVADTTPPVVRCPANRTVSANRRGIAEVPNFLARLLVSDVGTPAENLVATQSPTNGTVVGCGTTAVTLTVRDAAGNQSTCTVSFTVVDTTPPVISCLQEIVRHARANGQAEVPNLLERLNVRDNCTPPEALVKTQSPAPGTLLGLGRHEIKFRAVDSAGNASDCVVQLLVVDRTPPKIVSLQTSPAFLVDGSKELVPVYLTAVVQDNCDSGAVCRIISVSSSDPVTGPGDKTSPDWLVTSNMILRLRAERSAPNHLRVYTVKIACTDASGNTSVRSVSVPVRPAPRANVR